MGSGFRDIGHFQNCHNWAWNLASGQSSRSCTYTLFLPHGGWNWAYFRSTGSGFRDTGRFSKLPYLSMKLGKWPKRRSCTYTLFLPQGVEIKLIFALRAAVSEIRTILQNCHIWAWNLAVAKVPEVAHISSFYPRGAKLGLFLLYGQRFRHKGRFSKLPYLGMKLGKWPKFQKLHIYPLSTSGGGL